MLGLFVAAQAVWGPKWFPLVQGIVKLSAVTCDRGIVAPRLAAAMLLLVVVHQSVCPPVSKSLMLQLVVQLVLVKLVCHAPLSFGRLVFVTCVVCFWWVCLRSVETALSGW